MTSPSGGVYGGRPSGSSRSAMRTLRLTCATVASPGRAPSLRAVANSLSRLSRRLALSTGSGSSSMSFGSRLSASSTMFVKILPPFSFVAPFIDGHVRFSLENLILSSLPGVPLKIAFVSSCHTWDRSRNTGSADSKSFDRPFSLLTALCVFK